MTSCTFNLMSPPSPLGLLPHGAYSTQREGLSQVFDALRSEPPVPVLVRMSPDLRRQIDQAVRSRRIKIPRQTWILEAIIEKLEREAAAG
jgi:dihydroorotate dehydrogenase